MLVVVWSDNYVTYQFCPCYANLHLFLRVVTKHDIEKKISCSKLALTKHKLKFNDKIKRVMVFSLLLHFFFSFFSFCFHRLVNVYYISCISSKFSLIQFVVFFLFHFILYVFRVHFCVIRLLVEHFRLFSLHIIFEKKRVIRFGRI